MKSIDKKQKLNLLKADAQRLLSTDLIRIKGGQLFPKQSIAEGSGYSCDNGCSASCLQSCSSELSVKK